MAGKIAQIVYPVGQTPHNPAGTILIDWPHSRIYMADENTGMMWSYAIPSPLATLTVLNGPTAIPDFDAVADFMVCDSTGNIILQTGVHSGEPVHSVNPTTFTVIKTFGVVSSPLPPVYPAGLQGGCLAAACVTVNNVPYCVVQEGAFAKMAAVIRTDNMTAAGYYAKLSSSGVGGSSWVCSGASGSVGTVFICDYDPSPSSTCAIYKLTINTGAESYNIASWPTPNPDISSGLLVSLAAPAVDATWTTIVALSIGYDAFDDLVLLQVVPRTNVELTYLVALNPATGAIVWRNQLPSSSTPYLQGTRAELGQIAMLGNGAITWLNGYNAGLTGTVAGLGTTFRGYSSDDVSEYIVSQVSYVEADANAPVPVDNGTPASFSGWSIIANLWPFPPPPTPTPTPTPPTPTPTPPFGVDMTVTNIDVQFQTATKTDHMVTLRWSDDQGASWSNGLVQSLGLVGQYDTSIQWRRIGMSRNRVIEISWSGALASALNGVWINVEIAKT